MRFYRIKIVSLFAISIVAMLIDMKLAAIFTLIIAVLNIYSYFNFSRVLKTENFAGINGKVLTFLFTGFSINLLISALYFSIKVSYFGFSYMVHYLNQSITLLIVLTSSIFVFPPSCHNEIGTLKDKRCFDEDISKIIKYNLSFYLTLTFSMLFTALMKWPFFSTTHLLLIKIISDIILLLSNILNCRTNTPLFIHPSKIEHLSKKFTINLIDSIFISIIGSFLLLSAYALGNQRSGATTAIAMALFSFMIMRFLTCIDTSNKKFVRSWIAIPFLFLIAIFVIYSLNLNRLFFVAELSLYNWHAVFLLCFIMLTYICASSILKRLYDSTATNKDF